MTWLSTSRIISRILRLESKSFLCNQATNFSILYNPVKSSTFYQKKIITNFLLPSFPFSTDLKKTQSTTEGKNNITKSSKPRSEHKRRVYTKEEYELILQKVQQLGKDNPETWKSLAKELDVEKSHDIRRQYELITSRDTKENKRFTEEDELILQKVQQLGKDNPETWKSLAKDLDVEKSHDIRRQYELITSRDTKENKRFTEEDDQLILSYVSKNGQSASTWKELAKIFHMKHPTNNSTYGTIKRRHELLVKGAVKGIDKKIVKGAFTNKEDRIILKEVEKTGNRVETFKALAKKLNRPYSHNIQVRFEYLQNKPSRERGGWTLEDDRVFLEEIFQVRQ